ncbi:hypothetical protein D5S18_26400 [Nocardia panacis]|uniref:Bacterial transcriptional activator domain-containing protein n=1 Tax=Nocardia panacis TaxID=2340916 RepID=A0A3A4K7R7_9NOCA|nr:bacterial transcriptional activator domain-containing protein [Nocardia panacis]RJO70737.1 hypothetical protein D5S18_26400 [Nocardia panacis]
MWSPSQPTAAVEVREPRFLLLGPPVVSGADRVVVLKPGLRTNLLSLLLAARGNPVWDSALIAELWPRRPPLAAENALQANISRLRRDLIGWGLAAGEVGVRRILVGYVLECDPRRVDLTHFEVWSRDALRLGATDPEAALAAGRRALSLWRGRPLAGLDPPVGVRAMCARLEERYLQTLETVAACQLALGRRMEMLEDLSDLVIRYPYHERFHELLVEALFDVGRQDRGIRVYRQFCDRLRDELGVDPSPRLRSAYSRLLLRN